MIGPMALVTKTPGLYHGDFMVESIFSALLPAVFDDFHTGFADVHPVPPQTSI